MYANAWILGQVLLEECVLLAVIQVLLASERYHGVNYFVLYVIHTHGYACMHAYKYAWPHRGIMDQYEGKYVLLMCC